MDVRKGMVMRVPSAETEVQSTYAGKVIVDYNDLEYEFRWGCVNLTRMIIRTFSW